MCITPTYSHTHTHTHIILCQGLQLQQQQQQHLRVADSWQQLQLPHRWNQQQEEENSRSRKEAGGEQRGNRARTGAAAGDGAECKKNEANTKTDARGDECIRWILKALLQHHLKGSFQVVRRRGGVRRGEAGKCVAVCPSACYCSLSRICQRHRCAMWTATMQLGVARLGYVSGPLQFAGTVEPVTFAIFRSHNKLHWFAYNHIGFICISNQVSQSSLALSLPLSLFPSLFHSPSAILIFCAA